MFLNARENYQQLTSLHVLKRPDITCFSAILETVQKVAQSLEPLKDIGLSFEIALAGGSLRDFLSLQQDKIKDLDILVSLNNAPGFEYNLNTESNRIFDTMFSDFSLITEALSLKEFSFDQLKNTTHAEQFYYFLVSELLDKSWNVTRAYAPRPFSNQAKEAFAKQCVRSDYHNQFLRDVIKINDEKLSYPVDVLLCNTTSEDYVNSFDFEICKAFIVFHSLSEIENLLAQVKTDNEQQAVFDNLMSKILFSEGFAQDMSQKKLTLNPHFFDMDAVEHALMGHYPRIKDKFSDYQFYFDNTQPLVDEKVRLYIDEFEKYCAKHASLPDYEQSYDFKFKVNYSNK